jgi:predicted MFS family arabinose efflux permease
MTNPVDGTTAHRTWDLYTERQRWVYLILLFLVSTSNYIDKNVISVLLEPIKAEFGVSDTLLGLLTGISFALFYATLGIPIARWADWGNRKTIITLSLTVWSVMTTLCGLAQSFWQLALARIGVGAGEAGAIPPTHSLIADYFEPTRRSRAIAILMVSSTVGYLIGFIAGAELAAAYGWRSAFLVMGLPGVALAVVGHFVLKEPRELGPFRQPRESQETIWETIRALATKRSFVYLLIAMVLYFMIAYGAVVFFPSYLARVLDIPLARIGRDYGAVAAIGAIAGNIGGGFLTDRAARRQLAWVAWLPAIGLVLSWPVFEAMFLISSFPVFLALLTVGAFALNAAIPAMFAALHAVCGSPRRAMAVALVFFVANLLGLGLGPIITGALSDLFTARYGEVGIRHALMLVLTLLVPAGWFMYLSGRHLSTDLES